MSLFICDKCNAIENNHCIRNSNVDFVATMEHPNLWLMDMHGKYNFFIKNPNGSGELLYKERGIIQMLCSECNTGKWHNEFEKTVVKEDSDEKYISRFSPYRYITPADHIDGTVVRAEDNDGLLLSSEKVKVLADWITTGYNKKYNDTEKNIRVMAKNDIRVNWLLQIYMENEKAFEFTVIDRLFEDCIQGDAIYQFSLFIKDCLSEEAYYKSPFMITVEEFLSFAGIRDMSYITDEYIELERYRIIKNSVDKDNGLSFETKMLGAIQLLTDTVGDLGISSSADVESLKQMASNLGLTKYKKRTPHWKSTQPLDEKEEKIRKAQEKRERKQMKKR